MRTAYALITIIVSCALYLLTSCKASGVIYDRRPDKQIVSFYEADTAYVKQEMWPSGERYYGFHFVYGYTTFVFKLPQTMGFSAENSSTYKSKENCYEQ